MLRRRFTVSMALLLTLLLAGVAPAAGSQQASEIEVLHVRGPVYMLVGAGGNITVSVGPDGVLMVDTGGAEMSDKVLATIREIQKQLSTNALPEWKYAAETRSTLPRMLSPNAPPKPIRYVVNTHVHPDHVGGNEKIAAAGLTITGGNVAGNIRDAAEGAAVIAHENVLFRMSDPSKTDRPAPFGALPTDTYHMEGMKLSHFFNGEGIQIMHAPSAHSDGDSMVYFRGSDVIAAGDLFVTTTYPVIDIDRGGNIQGVIDGLNRILDLSIAEFRTEGGTMIVPGHGRLCDSADVAYYRDMVTIIRDRVQSMIREGMTLEQVKAARPTKDYDPRYGAATGLWTTDMFVEAVYRSLSVKR